MTAQPAMPPAAAMRVRSHLERPFSLMLEAVEYRIDQIVEHGVGHYELIPHAEYERIRIYVSDLARIRDLLAGQGDPLAYVSFIGEQRAGVDEAIEATDRALIGASPQSAPIIGYFSLQDPRRAWVNLVLFEGTLQLEKWMTATRHADDWRTAAGYFTRIEKSLGEFSYRAGATTISPRQLISRDYGAEPPESE